MSSARLIDRAHALQRHVVEVDHRHAVEVFESRAKRNELQQVRHDLHVDAFPARRLDEVEQLHVLLERQCDVEVVDLLVGDDVGGVAERAEQGQPAIAEVIAARLVVDEAHDLVTELAMLEDAIRDDAAEIAGARDQDLSQPDARQPSPFQRFANELARQVAERDVGDEEEAPDDPGHFERADLALRLAGVIRLVEQRRDDAQHDGEDAADEDVEEVVDARTAAAQPVQSLEVESQRNDQRDERQHVDVLLDGRVTARDGDEPRVETQQVGQDERQHAEHGIGRDVKGDEQPVVTPYHRDPAGAFSVSSTMC